MEPSSPFVPENRIFNDAAVCTKKVTGCSVSTRRRLSIHHSTCLVLLHDWKVKILYVKLLFVGVCAGAWCAGMCTHVFTCVLVGLPLL